MTSFARVRAAAPKAPTTDIRSDAARQPSACSACPASFCCWAFELGLCEGEIAPSNSAAGHDFDHRSIIQTIPARRTICHPNEWSEYISIICSGWATSSIALPDGRRQILSFLLPGDIASLAGLFEPVCGPLIEAVTDVSCRTFKRGELKSVLLSRQDLLEKMTRNLLEEKKQADELAVDLGRRTAEERLSRLILKLQERLAKRGMVRNQSFEFPLRQWQIADATGLTPVHVSKVLGELQRAKLIEIKERWLTILDLPELRRVADRCVIKVHFSGPRTG